MDLIPVKKAGKAVPVETGMVMSVGPAVAALTGVPAGRVVDRLGSFPVIVAGLLSVMTGSLLLALLPVAMVAGHNNQSCS